MGELAVSIAIAKAALLGVTLTEKLTSSCILPELKLLRRVDREVKYIKKELEVMTAFLAWAEEVEQESNGVARAWAKQVRELAYEIEDCIDEFTLHLSQSRRTMQSLLSLRPRHQIAAKIQSLKSEIVDVSSIRSRYDLKTASTPAAASSTSSLDPRLGAMFVEDAQLVGLDGPRDEILKWLLEEEHEQVGVISVFGMGGLGKTTLAKKVYDNSNFQCRAWVTVSQSFNAEQLLREMIKQLLQINVPEKNKVQLVEEIRNHLQKERCLIVFDDLWSISAWESLKLALPENGSGSWIIVTTRNEAVANTCCTSHHHHHHTYRLEFLSSEKSWELFCKRVFPGPNHDCPPELKELSEDILKKCGGLPLAIVTTAGILASKPKKTGEEWRNLLSRLKQLGGSELDTNPASLEGMKQVLNLGYNDLPYHLKHCFLYLSIFPEDYLINSKRLQRMWIAEGFIGEHRGMTKEDVAESYFNELNNRSMILPSVISANGKVTNFQLHDIMLEVIISKSMEMNTVFLREGHKNTWISGDVVRRLSVYSDPNGSMKNILEGVSLSSVRTSAIFNHGAGSLSVFRPMRMLRVVNFDWYCFNHSFYDFAILGKLRHLKYLSLRDTTMRVLPESYRKLVNLQVLDIRNHNMKKLPKWIGELQQLRHISVGRYHSILVTKGVVVPKGIRRLKSLQSLSYMDVRDAAKELGELSKLRKLDVSILSEQNMMDFCASLAKLSCLRSLMINFVTFGDAISLDDDHVGSSPPLLLQDLEIRGPLVSLPRWVGSLNEMVKLTLWVTKLGNDGIGLQLLQALPNLNHFELRPYSYIGDHLCFGGGFGSLKVLVLWGLELKSLEFVGGAMINLQSLRMVLCNDLETILGCEGLINLKVVKVTSTSEQQVDMVRRIVEAHPAKPRFLKNVL